MTYGYGKLHFFGRDYILLALFVQKHILGKDTFWVDPYTPLYEKGKKETQNKLMETTWFLVKQL